MEDTFSADSVDSVGLTVECGARVKAVDNPGFRAQVLLARRGFDLLAKTEQDLQEFRAVAVVAGPVCCQHRARCYELSGMTCQIDQDIEFLWRQGQCFASEGDFTLDCVDSEIAGVDDFRCGHAMFCVVPVLEFLINEKTLQTPDASH